MIGSVSIIGFSLRQEHLKYALVSLFISPLYSRENDMDLNQDIQDSSIRGRIYKHISINPGSNLSRIKKELSIGYGTTVHHLTVLQRGKHIIGVKNGKHLRYWIKDDFPGNARASISEVQKQIIATIINNDGLSRKELATIINISKSTLHYNLMVLIRKELIHEVKDGKHHYCYLSKHRDDV